MGYTLNIDKTNTSPGISLRAAARGTSPPYNAKVRRRFVIIIFFFLPQKSERLTVKNGSLLFVQNYYETAN